MTAPHLTAPAFQVPNEDLERYADWTECVAFRFLKHEDGSYELQVANDLEAITRPEGSS